MKIPSSLIISFIRFFSNAKIMEIAINTGFLKRKRSILPDTIVKVFILGLLNIPNPSLKQIASKCEEIQPGLEITKHAIYNRLPSIALFLQQIFLQFMKIAVEKAVPAKTAEILFQFKDVKICDSTKITLPDKLADTWPGLGGRNAKSSLKIQGLYSLISSSFSNLELTKAPGNDTTYNKSLVSMINKNELLITDLGYFCKTFFDQLASKGAYYLSRIRTNTAIYIEKAGQIKEADLAQMLKGHNVIDTIVYIGVEYKEQLKCRLVAIRLPDEVVNERRRKAHKKANAKGKQLTSQEIELLAFNIIITNVGANMLCAEAVCDLYRARWQIELVFKTCKSYLNIDKLGSCGSNQLECLIYGRMIAATVAYLMYNALYIEMYHLYQRGTSLQLFVKLWADQSTKIICNMYLNVSAIRMLEQTLTRIAKHSLHEKRKRKTTLEILQEYCLPKIILQNMA